MHRNEQVRLTTNNILFAKSMLLCVSNVQNASPNALYGFMLIRCAVTKDPIIMVSDNYNLCMYILHHISNNFNMKNCSYETQARFNSLYPNEFLIEWQLKTG